MFRKFLLCVVIFAVYSAGAFPVFASNILRTPNTLNQTDSATLNLGNANPVVFELGQRVLVNTNSMTLYSQPNTNSEIVTELESEAELAILSARYLVNDQIWYFVRHNWYEYWFGYSVAGRDLRSELGWVTTGFVDDQLLVAAENDCPSSLSTRLVLGELIRSTHGAEVIAYDLNPYNQQVQSFFHQDILETKEAYACVYQNIKWEIGERHDPDIHSWTDPPSGWAYEFEDSEPQLELVPRILLNSYPEIYHSTDLVRVNNNYDASLELSFNGQIIDSLEVAENSLLEINSAPICLESTNGYLCWYHATLVNTDTSGWIPLGYADVGPNFVSVE